MRSTKVSKTKSQIEKSGSQEVADFKKILSTAKDKAGSKTETLTYSYPDGLTMTATLQKGSATVGSTVQQLLFSSGRVITLTAQSGKETVYSDSNVPQLRLTELSLDRQDGSIMYKRAMGASKGTALVKETSSGAKYATLKLGRETREIELTSDAKRIFKGKEGTMTVSPDGSLVSLKPKAGGSIEVYPWVKLVAVEFPDGHKQTFYASDKEVNLLKNNPVGFYVNWLPKDKQGHHFEWGTLQLS